MFKAGVFLMCALGAFAATAAAADIRVQNPVPYAEGSAIARNIKAECPLGQQLAEFVREFSARRNIPIVLTDAAPGTASGRVLTLEISDAVSVGNAFVGHRKSSTVRGALFENGSQTAAFVARRHSGGGFGAGFKGSCSVLGRTVRAIGSDIATWLSHPVDGAQLGDL